MAINPINISRISHNLTTSVAVESLRQNQREVFSSQTRIASGQRFVTPGEDPIGAARVLDLTQAQSLKAAAQRPQQAFPSG